MKKRTSQHAEGPDRLNVLVEGTRVNGDIIMESSVRVDGEITGNVASSSKVVIGKNGLLKGDLNCAEADIEGAVSGKLVIEGLLTLRASATISGDIHCSRIQIEDGAQFSGKCIMGNAGIFAQKSEENTADLVY